MDKHKIDKLFKDTLGQHESDLPKNLWDNLESKLEQEQKKPIWYILRQQKTLGIAATLLLLLVSIGVWQYQPKPNTQSAQLEHDSVHQSIEENLANNKKPDSTITDKSSEKRDKKSERNSKPKSPKDKQVKRAPSRLVPSYDPTLHIAEQKKEKQGKKNEEVLEVIPEIKETPLADNLPQPEVVPLPQENLTPETEPSLKVVVTVKLSPQKSSSKSAIAKRLEKVERKSKSIEVFGLSPEEALAAIGKGEK